MLGSEPTAGLKASKSAGMAQALIRNVREQNQPLRHYPPHNELIHFQKKKKIREHI